MDKHETDWRDTAIKVGGDFYIMEGRIWCTVLDEEGVAHFLGETVAECRCWVIGYLRGREQGINMGAEVVRRSMRDALGVPHPKGEE